MGSRFEAWRRFAGLVLISAAYPMFAKPPDAGRMVLVADSRRFPPWESWWANLYNESHLLFALLTVAVISALALLTAGITDFLLSRIGINLRSRVLAEH